MHMTADERTSSDFDKMDPTAINGAVNGVANGHHKEHYEERTGAQQV